VSARLPPGRFLSGWPVALRLAWREMRRARGRAALVVAMIAVPVAGLSYAAVSWDMFALTDAERVDREIGAADAFVSWPYEVPVAQDRTGNPIHLDAEPPRRARPYTREQLQALLPPGSRVLPDERPSLTLHTPSGGMTVVEGRGLDLTDPMTRGIGHLVGGRAPAGHREVALTEDVADRLGTRVGDTIRSFDDGAGWTVVGLVRFPASMGEVVAYRPGDLPGVVETAPDFRRWLVDTPGPLTWPQVRALNALGAVADSRAVRLDPPPDPAVSPYPGDGVPASDVESAGSVALLAGLGVLEVVLLAGPAFAVGARTRRRELALIAANGGTPAHLRRVVLADGVVLGAAGAAAGVAVGIALAWFGRPISERYVFQAYAGGFRVFPTALLVICAAAVVTGVLAALVPAATAARQPVVAGLSGRRGAVRSRPRWLVLGLALIAGGGATAVAGALKGSFALILLGLTGGEIGLVLCTPSLLGLVGRLGHRLPPAPRMAVRDTARNRSSAAPAISAVMAAVAGTVAVGVILASDESRGRREHRRILPERTVVVLLDTRDDGQAPARSLVAPVTGVLRTVLGADLSVPFDEVTCPPGTESTLTCDLTPVVPDGRRCPFVEPDLLGRLSEAQRRAANADPRCASGDVPTPAFPGAVTADPAVLTALTGVDADGLGSAPAVLAAGGVVTTDDRAVVDGRITLRVRIQRADGSSVRDGPTVTGPAAVVPGGVAVLVVAPAVAAAAGLPTTASGVLGTVTAVPEEARQERFDAALRAISATATTVTDTGPMPSDAPYLLLLAIAAGLVTLGAAGVATGLAAVDGRGDLAVLSAIGASPRVRRLLSVSQAGVISGLGTLLGMAAGFAAAYTILTALNQGLRDPAQWPREVPYPPTVPWSVLAVLVVVPVIAMLGAGLFTRSRLPVERRRE
jgi:putative ABC transport system permease protein